LSAYAREAQASDEMARLFVLTGPSGVGKDSVRNLLIEWGVDVHFTVNATDRAARPGEVDGRDYHFMTAEAFDALVKAGGFIEHAIVYGQRKGVPRAEIQLPLSQGRDVLARVDVQGAATLKRLYPDAVVIFLAPPSLEESARRLEERDTESESQRRVRRQTAEAEVLAIESADYVVVNRTGQLEATALRVREIIDAERGRGGSAE
jgi:guanylate kinase